MTGRRLHATLTIAWALTPVPTPLWLRDSILWVAFMSPYANVVGHWSAYQAARAEESGPGSMTTDERTRDEG